MNKINIDQVKVMFSNKIDKMINIELYTRIISTTRVYSDLTRSKDTIKFNNIQRNSILMFTHNLSLLSFARYKVFHKIRINNRRYYEKERNDVL